MKHLKSDEGVRPNSDNTTLFSVVERRQYLVRPLRSSVTPPSCEVVPENRTAVIGGIRPNWGASQGIAKRRNFSAAFKAKVALEALRGAVAKRPARNRKSDRMLILNGWFLRPVTMTCNRQLRLSRVCDGRALVQENSK